MEEGGHQRWEPVAAGHTPDTTLSLHRLQPAARYALDVYTLGAEETGNYLPAAIPTQEELLRRSPRGPLRIEFTTAT